MTPEMAFEGLLISQNKEILSTMYRVLDGFSIATDVCVRASKAIEQCDKPSVDLIVLDCENEHLSTEIMRRTNENTKKRKPTIVAIVNDTEAVDRAKKAGAHLVVRKPITLDLGTRSIKEAYSLMIRDYRRYARHAILNCVTASIDDGEQFPVTVTDISEGGVGLLTKESLKVGSLLNFPVALHSAEREIGIKARVVWANEYGAAGAEFVNISAADLRILYRWLWSRCRFKGTMIH